jgi:hypothetical protein
MKVVMEKIDIVVKLKEKIAEAKANNDALAAPLQKLLESIVKDTNQSPAI